MSPMKGFRPIAKNKKYLISRGGMIFSLNVKKLIKTRFNELGYLLVSLYHPEIGKQKTYKVSRLLLEAWVRPPRHGEQAAHLDGNPRNNNLSNLKWATPQENSDHQLKHGTRAFGQKSAHSKLTDDQVRAIRKFYKPATRSNALELAKKYGVTRDTIYRVAARSLWPHI